MAIIKKRQERIESMEITISNLLRIGVLMSAGLIVLGLVLLIGEGGSGYPGATFPASLAAIRKGLLTLKPDAVILTGLLLLVLTPVLRVAVSIVAFWQERDYRYMVIATIVLLVLLIGFCLGKVV